MSTPSLDSHQFSPFRDTITSSEDSIRNRSLDSLCGHLDLHSLLQVASQLDLFWRETANLYHRVRAMFYLASIYRYYVPKLLPAKATDRIPFEAHEHLLSRRFTEAIDQILIEQKRVGPGPGLASSLARAYHQIAFQTLSDQVRKSVRSVRGNQWMFRIGHPSDHPLRLDRRMLPSSGDATHYPILFEATSVRMDFTHSAWSDIFFLGMDFPEGAKVINASIDLGVFGRDAHPRPPVEAYLRVIDRPVLRLVSVDLGAETEITAIDEVFDFARDYLGLLKSAIIASGIVPSAMEGCHQPISKLFETLIGRTGVGLELVSRVNDIPKGSRLAVSTNLLGCLISVLMRASGQITSFEGMLTEQDRRLVAARAILGEWLGGSGGGWQDSGGVWPGIKLIEGCPAKEGDPEFGISRGRLLPQHTHLNDERISPETKRALQESLILVHGGMAQNVGPILEMVTEKYLLRGEREWKARREAIEILDRMLKALREGDLRQVGHWTTVNFQGPLQAIIPWCTNLFTDSLIELSRAKYGDQFWGFWMLGGMSGGGMGFIFDPSVKQEAKSWLQSTMLEVKRGMENQVPFAMDPVVYDFAINERGSWAELLRDESAVMPMNYYAITAPKWIKQDIRQLSEQTQNELMSLGQLCRSKDSASEWLIDRILPQRSTQQSGVDRLQSLLKQNGFDREAHQHIREEMLSGRIGLSQNRLSPQTRIEDVQSDDVIDVRDQRDAEIERLGAKLISEGQVGVVTLAAGAGSRWTGGAGVVKGLHAFCKLGQKHRNFVEIHLAKSQKVSDTFRATVPHVFTTGYLTQQPIETYLKKSDQGGYRGPVYVSSGKSVGLRLIPTLRDLRFFWEEMPQQILDEQQQKVRESARASLSQWACRWARRLTIPTIYRCSACIRLGIGMKSRTCFETVPWKKCSRNIRRCVT